MYSKTWPFHCGYWIHSKHSNLLFITWYTKQQKHISLLLRLFKTKTISIRFQSLKSRHSTIYIRQIMRNFLLSCVCEKSTPKRSVCGSLFCVSENFLKWPFLQNYYVCSFQFFFSTLMPFAGYCCVANFWPLFLYIINFLF